MKPKPLLPPTMEERAIAAQAARALRAVIEGKTTPAGQSVMHVDCSRPKRSFWIASWENVPGFKRVNGTVFQHDCLPGWEYARAEIKTEMIPDLEALAEQGVRPTEVTMKKDKFA